MERRLSEGAAGSFGGLGRGQRNRCHLKGRRARYAAKYGSKARIKQMA
jgi:hypothetical protein